MDKVIRYESPAGRPEIYTLHGLENFIRIAAKHGDENLLRLGATHNDVIDTVHVLGMGNATFKKVYAEHLRTRGTPDLAIVRAEEECADDQPRPPGKRELEDGGKSGGDAKRPKV